MPDFTAVVGRIGRHIADTHRRCEVEDELLDHLEAAVRGLHARGLSLEDAVGVAMQQLGDPDEIGRELGRVHNGIKLRYFAVGGLLWYLVSAIISESHVIYLAREWRSLLPYWLVQLPFQVLGLPHWFVLQSPQIHNLTILDTFEWYMAKSYQISGRHIDGVIGVVILTSAVYGLYRLARYLRMSEVLKGWSMIKVPFRR